MNRPPGQPSDSGPGDRPRVPVGVEASVAELAAEIRKLGGRAMRLGVLGHPRINAELEELNQQAASALDQPRGRHRLPAPVRGVAVQDVAGYSLKPDPLTARTGADLIAILRRYREWAGNIPFRTMAARARWEVAHSTMCVALKGDALPKLEVVMAIVTGCGGSAEDQQAFATAWRRIRSGAAGVQGLRLVHRAGG